MRFSHTLSTCKHYVYSTIIVLAMTLFLAGCPSLNDPAPNDSKPLLTITPTQASVTEGGTSTITITRDNVEGRLEVSLTLSGSAEHNVDYTVDGQVFTQSLQSTLHNVDYAVDSTVNTDSTTGDKTMTVVFVDSNKSVDIPIIAVNDLNIEPNGETVEIEINESDDYTIGDPYTATLTIVDPLPVVSISTSGENKAVNEGGSISVTISSNQTVTDNLEVSLTIGGTATINEDYTTRLDIMPQSDIQTTTVTIPGGSTTVTFTITAGNDEVPEDTGETVEIEINESDDYTIGDHSTATLTIVDPSVVGISTSTSGENNINEGGRISVTITSNQQVPTNLDVSLTIESGSTATINADYTTSLDTTPQGPLSDIQTATVTIPGESTTVTFTIDAIDDGFDDIDESLIITIDPSNDYELAAGNNGSHTVTVIIKNDSDVDDDDNGLIEIHNLDMLRNVHFNLAGTNYDDEEDDGSGNGATGSTSGGPTSSTDHCKIQVDGGVYLCGYELTRNLDFTDAGSYATGIINTEWRPDPEGNSNNATNEGFPGIGTKTGSSGGFTGIFEGNGYSISNLYMRTTTTTQGYNTGLFRLTEAGAKIRNLGMMNVSIYGGAGSFNNVGGLVGWNYAAITASYATGTVDGGGGIPDLVGGLVGYNFGDITASYASGDVDGGAGNNDQVGGLVGYNNNGTITASYATGTVDGGAGDNDRVGGLVGYNNNGTITASYATGDVDGGAGDRDRVGGLVGNSNRPITASYGFGTPSGEIAGSDGDPKPDNVTEASDLTKDNAGSEWNNAVSNTLGAWDFGTSDQNPALKYADYDGPGNTYSCDLFPATIPGTDNPLVCGTTLLPGQRD